MFRSLLVAAFSFACLVSQAQTKDTGIYVPIKCSKHVTTYLTLLSLKPVCLANNPIVAAKEFESVSNVIEHFDEVYFDLTFSPKGYETLVKLQNSFPYAELALMVEGEVLMTFSMSDKRLNRTFRFQGQWRDRELFYRVHAQIMGQLAALSE